MWQKIKDQLPTVILTVIIVVASAFWIHQRTVSEMAAKQQMELAPLREQNDALKVAAVEVRLCGAQPTVPIREAVFRCGLPRGLGQLRRCGGPSSPNTTTTMGAPHVG